MACVDMKPLKGSMDGVEASPAVHQPVNPAVSSICSYPLCPLSSQPCLGSRSEPVTVLSLTFVTLLACHPSAVAPDLSSGTPFLQCRPASVSCNLGKLCPTLQVVQMCVIQPYPKRGQGPGSSLLFDVASPP